MRKRGCGGIFLDLLLIIVVLELVFTFLDVLGGLGIALGLLLVIVPIGTVLAAMMLIAFIDFLCKHF